MNNEGKFGKKYISNIERIRKNTTMRRRQLFTSGIGRSKPKSKFNNPDEDYGLADPLDDAMNEDEFSEKKIAFLEKLNKVDRDQLELLTRNQNLSQEWFNERKKRLTASKFGEICNMRATTSCKVKVHNILYKPSTICKELTHGLEFEPLAKLRFQELSGLAVQSCGLFVDKEYPYLAASPDNSFIYHKIVFKKLY